MPTDVPGFRFRPATLEDARSIAEVQVRVRMTTYRGLLSDEYLDGLPAGLEGRVRKWKTRLENPGTSHSIIVEQTDGAVVGFCIALSLPHADPQFTALIDIIYLLKEHQRHGVGGALLREAARLLSNDGHRTLYLWVHAGNTPARRFYEKMGGVRFLNDSSRATGSVGPKSPTDGMRVRSGNC